MLMDKSSGSADTAKSLGNTGNTIFEVTHEKFEGYAGRGASGSYLGYEGESRNVHSCDYVGCGMLKDTFTD